MEGQLPCLKFLVSMGISPTHVLGARNDQGETPKDLAQQFYKDNIIEYITGIEWERDHPEEAESMLFLSFILYSAVLIFYLLLCCFYLLSFNTLDILKYS